MPSVSFSVGTLANCGLRCGAMMARERARPASMMARASGTEQVTMSTPPAARSCMAGAAPFEGTQRTWSAARPMAPSQPASARCQMPPWPVPEALNCPGREALIASARALMSR